MRTSLARTSTRASEYGTLLLRHCNSCKFCVYRSLPNRNTSDQRFSQTAETIQWTGVRILHFTSVRTVRTCIHGFLIIKIDAVCVCMNMTADRVYWWEVEGQCVPTLLHNILFHISLAAASEINPWMSACMHATTALTDTEWTDR